MKPRCCAGCPSIVGGPFTVPADRVALLRAAFDAMVADADFRIEAAQLRLLVAPMTGAEVARRVGDLYSTPADVLNRAKIVGGE